MVAVTNATDAPGFNFHFLKKGTQVCGYTTGADGVAWTAQMWAEFPDAVRICQNPGATDHTADVLDVESGAATLADCAPWAKAALASFNNGTRPGQRYPAIYCSQSSLTAVANALVKGGVPKLAFWVADWNGYPNAMKMLGASSGPFPVIGVQYADNGSYDSDVFLTSWLTNRSKKKVKNGTTVTPKAPPGQWDDAAAWTWQEASVIGTGLDGKLHVFTFSPSTGEWVKAE